MEGNKADKRWLLARPGIEAEEAAQLVAQHFGVEGRAVELGSQQDRNYRVDHESGRGLLFKVNHPSVPVEVLELQSQVSDRLRVAGIATPAVLSTVSGERSIAIPAPDGSLARACAFELVSGASVADLGPLTGALAEDLGTLAGRVVRALEGFGHAAAHREIQWELSQGLDVVKALQGDLPAHLRDVCLNAAQEAAAQLKALAPALPRQIIHGDLTSDNVLQDEQGGLWVVDLGDAAYSWRVAELAVLAADILGRTDSMAMVSRAVRGFATEVELSDEEIAAVWPMIILRGAVLAVSGWSQLRVDPENGYARERLEHEWKVFERTVDREPAQAFSHLRLAAGRAHIAGLDYSEVLPGIGEARVVDLGVRSESLDCGRWIVAGVERELVREALTLGPVAVMRFGETRLSRVSLDVGQSASTRARCVELWARSGTIVSAPFSGALVETGSGLELADGAVVLRFEGVSGAVLNGGVRAGEPIGQLAPDPEGLGRLVVTRRVLDASGDAAFAGPDDEYETEGAADPSRILGVSSVPDPLVELHAARARRDRAMGGAAERYYAEPPQIERGWGTRLIDTQGRAYLDMVNNVTAIGHSHPRLADAVGRQLNLLNTNLRFLYEAYADFSEKLLAYTPDPSLDTVIPVNSGSEAIDLAIRLARVATGRRDVIATREGYHGWTMAADAVSTSAFDNPNALSSRPEWVHLVDAPNAYRGPFRGQDAGARYAAQVSDVAAGLVAENRPPAAFICEPVLGNAGGVIPPEGYLAEAYSIVRRHGGLAIADEVQVGYGRLGAAFWGSQMQGAVPDIIAVAKAAGNAYPVGAVITRREIVDALREEGMFFSSAAGAPASAVAGSAVLDVIREEGLQANAGRVGDHLRQRLSKLSEKHPIIGAVHGSGLYLGVELVRDRELLTPATAETAWLCERLLGLGVIMQATSERQNVLKVKPPLTLTLEEADAFVNALDVALTELIDGEVGYTVGDVTFIDGNCAPDIGDCWSNNETST
ncbi:aminotransferase [Mycolicibacterium sp. YH-1]|uniref:aminotransferase n=1 Tax=Mycolicibacterium sp. YH-1 TaxID=2908837 RepID=UPI001F4C1466|nr:aminotransferase [Mycolicibacterium sp. YH-1]UNB54444.1 aminotransferase [Mycolicibacterium sp. YH-1]